MNVNELQGRYILREGWLPREQVSAAWRSLGPGQQLCDALQQRGLLDPTRAEQARAAARSAASRFRRPTEAFPNVAAIQPPAAPGGPLAAPSSGRFAVPTTPLNPASSGHDGR